MKQSIRKNILAKRDLLPLDARVSYSEAITARLLQMPEYRHAETVLGYMNLGSEFASEPWVERVLADGKRLVLPKVNRHTNHLDLYHVEDPESQLAPGLWGIREPVVELNRRQVSINEVEFALLPGVAFAFDGARLGYGKGYYDRLLAGMNDAPVLVAAAFALQVVERLPQEATDVRVEWIITEQETISCSEHFSEG